MKKHGEAAWDTFVAYRLIWLRVFFYFFLPAGMLFLTLTETFSGATWAAMSTFEKGRLYFACIMAGSSALVAFMDASFQKANQHRESLRAQRETGNQGGG